MHNAQPIEYNSEINKQAEYITSSKLLIEDVIMNAITATYSITENHPKSAKGTTFYNEVISGLRDSLRPKGFERLYINNIELTVSKDLGLAFYFCRGDEQTGKKDGFPLSLRKKGNITQQVLGLKAHSVQSYELFPELNETIKPEITIWSITIFADFTNNNYRAELGVPLSVNRKGYIDVFEHRIMLDINNNELTSDIADKPVEFTEDLDIDISQNEQIAS